VRREELEGGARGKRERADVHHVLVGHIRVGEDDLVDVVLADQVAELVLGVDRDSVGVELAGEERGIDAPRDVRDLRRSERDDLVVLVPAVDDVEVVEVAAGGACDQDSCALHEYGVCT
jgi:hypothetical protein